MDQDEALKLTYHFSSMRGSSLFIFLKIKYHGGNFFFLKKKNNKKTEIRHVYL